MKMSNEERAAALALRLIAGSSGEQHDLSGIDTSGIDWAELLRVAGRNKVLVRLAAALERAKAEPPEFFAAAAQRERERVAGTVQAIRRINQLCSESGVEFILAKAFQHYPDMGNDIDLFVLARSSQVDALVIGSLGGAPKSRSLANLISGTANYRISGCEPLLEIHHGRLGVLGECGSYLASIIRNGRRIVVEGMELLAPSDEDQLILQAMQKIYARPYIRLSDVACTIALARRDNMDWDYVARTAGELGVLHGLRCYLSYVSRIRARYCGGEPLSYETRKPFAAEDRREVEFQDGFFRFPRLRVASRVYAEKFRAALLSGDVRSAGRLCLLPLVAAAALTIAVFSRMRPSSRSG